MKILIDDFEVHHLRAGSWCPNNEDRPLLIYHAVHQDGPEALARWFEACFEANGWPPAWRYTIFSYPHYHSNTHEVVGVYQGKATIRLGAESGFDTLCVAGDVLIIPAGVSHERLESSDDFMAVGAYPAGCEPDEIRSSQDYEQAVKRIADIPIPRCDPVTGNEHRFKDQWADLVRTT